MLEIIIQESLRMLKLKKQKEDMDKELSKNVDTFFTILIELGKEYPLELQTEAFFGTSVGVIKRNVEKLVEVPYKIQKKLVKDKIEIQISSTPSGKIIVSCKNDDDIQPTYRITKEVGITLLLEMYEEPDYLKVSKSVEFAKEIAEKINDILAPNSVKFIKDL